MNTNNDYLVRLDDGSLFLPMQDHADCAISARTFAEWCAANDVADVTAITEMQKNEIQRTTTWRDQRTHELLERVTGNFTEELVVATATGDITTVLLPNNVAALRAMRVLNTRRPEDRAQLDAWIARHPEAYRLSNYNHYRGFGRGVFAPGRVAECVAMRRAGESRQRVIGHFYATQVRSERFKARGDVYEPDEADFFEEIDRYGPGYQPYYGCYLPQPLGTCLYRL